MQLAVREPLAPRELTAQAELLRRLLELTGRELPSPCFQVRAQNAYCLSAVELDGPVLALPLQGSKRARQGNEWLSIVRGEIFLVCHATRVDVENLPDPDLGRYTAICIRLEQPVLDAARQLLREPVGVGEPAGRERTVDAAGSAADAVGAAAPVAAGGSFATGAEVATAGGINAGKPDARIASVPLDPHVEALTLWLDALERGDSPFARYALAGLVLRFHSHGYRALLHPPPARLSTRIRTLIAADPTRDWSSADLESQLGMSGATLRRHLASEGTSLRDLIGDARLSQALALLVTTRLPVKSVASRVGYVSVSSFAKRFRERYGVEPSRVRSE